MHKSLTTFPVEVNQLWVYGGICLETEYVFLYVITDRTAVTLLDKIQACIAPSSIIIPYLWASCQGI